MRIVGVKKPRKFEHFSKAVNQSAVFLGVLTGLVSLLGAALLIDPITNGNFQRWADLANPPGVADPPWQYYAISFSAFIVPIAVGIIVTRLVRKLSQRTTRSMKVVL
jgi:uncharacterized PurR-regulated membrane protein YhhQ (DUF165 family)